MAGFIVMNQIFNTKIQAVSDPATINLGDVINLCPEENSKSSGGSSPVGDFPINIDGEVNIGIDPDLFDQVDFL
ncbi:spore germination protein [Mechercharimyces sp. CAU 1602]|uniref:spore germination protein n=1 Tax=Mechercharimyces sp. CAU 1602 TaxID=2973933 RepID=UPI002162E8A7|nr:spore germination protein [Mechercharimyces sp. CAU 1602]MCS1350494.1 spore germination protein [Mechercharimyces sp. CAU 1602]